MPKEVKASIALFVASLITKGISYITTPIFTRMLSSDEYGQVAVFLTWQNVFGILAMFCLMNGVFNNGMVDYPEERDEYSFSMLILSNTITLAVCGVLFILFPVLKTKLHIEFYQLVLMMLVFFSQPAYSFWTARQRYEFKYKATVFWSVIIAIAAPFIAIICIRLFPEERLRARLIGAEIPLFIIYCGFYYYLAKNSRFKINTRFWKAAFLFNLPLIPHYLSSLLLSSSDRLMISALINDKATAYYSVAASIASVVLIVWTAVNSSLIPYTYEKCKIKDYKAISKATIGILFIFVFCCVLLILIAPELVAFMAPPEYNEAIFVIPPLVGGVFFQVLYYVFSNIVYYYKKPVFVMIASVTATILNLALNYIFIPRYGYISAAYATIVCYIVQALIDYLAMKKVVGQDIYDMKLLLALSTLVLVIALFSNLLYVMPAIRYFFIIVLIAVLVFFRNSIFRLYKSVRSEE